MSDLKLDSAGDITKDGFDFALITGDDEIAQRLQIKLRTFRNDWFLDTSFGIPYYQSVLKKNPDTNVIEAVFKSAILGVEGVASIERLEFFYNTPRSLTVEFTVRTVNGTTVGGTV